jgi:hypothetical protein
LGAKVKKFDKMKISLTKSLTKSGLVDLFDEELDEERTSGQVDW